MRLGNTLFVAQFCNIGLSSPAYLYFPEAPHGNFVMRNVKKRGFILRQVSGRISHLALRICSMRNFEKHS